MNQKESVMEKDTHEEIITKGDFSKLNAIALIFFVISIIAFAVAISLGQRMHPGDGFVDTYIFLPSSGEGSAVVFYVGIILLVISIYFLIKMKSCEITVTNKRVFGKTAFGKLVDLPLDMISAVGTSFPKGISVATASGKIKFWLLNNKTELYHTITELLRKRQTSNKESVVIASKSDADELKKYKELFDSGVITQEEFEAKKRQILDGK